MGAPSDAARADCFERTGTGGRAQLAFIGGHCFELGLECRRRVEEYGWRKRLRCWIPIGRRWNVEREDAAGGLAGKGTESRNDGARCDFVIDVQIAGAMCIDNG